MKKIILLIYLNFIFIIGSFVAGQSTVKYDCEIGSKPWDIIKKDLEDYFKKAIILNEKAVQKAHEHLGAYCCTKKIIKEGCSGGGSENKFPESPMFVDHLQDVGFRILDGDEKYTYGLEVDKDAKKYREQVRKLAEAKEGTEPKNFNEMYEKNWTSKDYNTGTNLSSKYRIICEESYEISMSVLKMYSKDNRGQSQGNCSQMAEKRILQEQTYTKSIGSRKGKKLDKDNKSDYLRKYFSERYGMFLEKLGQSVSKIMHVSKKATPGVENANN